MFQAITIAALIALATLTVVVLLRSRGQGLAHLPGPNASSWIIGSLSPLVPRSKY